MLSSPFLSFVSWVKDNKSLFSPNEWKCWLQTALQLSVLKKEERKSKCISSHCLSVMLLPFFLLPSGKKGCLAGYVDDESERKSFGSGSNSHTALITPVISWVPSGVLRNFRTLHQRNPGSVWELLRISKVRSASQHASLQSCCCF